MDGTSAQFAELTDLELELTNVAEPVTRKGSKKSAAAAARPSMAPRPARRHEARAVHQVRRPASIMPAALAPSKAPRMSKEKRARMDARRAQRLLEEFTPLVRKIAGGFQEPRCSRAVRCSGSTRDRLAARPPPVTCENACTSVSSMIARQSLE